MASLPPSKHATEQEMARRESRHVGRRNKVNQGGGEGGVWLGREGGFWFCYGCGNRKR